MSNSAGVMDMKDMSKAGCRIYVGNLAECVDTDALAERFAPYGVIVGVKRRPRQSYAFVQFETEISARNAIRNENQKMFAGRPLVVNAAVSNASSSAPLMPLMSATPVINVPPAPLSNSGSYSSSIGNSMNDNPNGGNDPPPHSGRAGNDCEIVVVSKRLTEYAEHIEDRLKRHGLSVDLLYPNEDVPIGRVLANVLSRGTLYAILVMPQNEERRSLTLNILHGLPQEHRNMPLDDAIALIARNFAELRRCGSTAGREAIVALLHQMANGRILTVHQYDRIIEYVKDCRDRIADTDDRPAEVDHRADLRQRIMSILNDGGARTGRPPDVRPPDLGMYADGNQNAFGDIGPGDRAVYGTDTGVSVSSIRKMLDTIRGKMP